MGKLSTITNENAVFYNRTLLSRMVPKLLFAKYGQARPLPKRNGTVMEFRRFESIAPNTTALQEGVTPDGTVNAVTKIKATVEQYGDYIPYTDVIDTHGIDPYVTETSEVLGEQAGESIDNIIRDKIALGTNVYYANAKAGRSAITTADKINATDIAKIARTLKKNKAPTMANGYYIGIVDPSVAFDLMQDPLWQDVSKYNGGTKIERGEIGKLHGIRFIETTQVAVKEGAGAAGIDVHCCMFIGKDAYGVVDVKNSSRKGILMGQKNARYIAVIDKFSVQMESINPSLQYLHDFCADYNKAEHKRELMTLLSRYTISYDMYQNGIDNPTPLQQEGLSKASKLKLFSLKPNDLTYTGNIESNKDKGIGKTLNQFLKSKSIVDTAITLLSIAIFASFTLQLVSDFSWGNMIWAVLQVIVFLIKGSMSFVSAYMFITEDHANRIIRQTNLLREFENTADKYVEQSKEQIIITNIKEHDNVQEE